jgi:ankyrin repeat protein
VQKGCDIHATTNDKSKSPLHYAVRLGHIKFVELLLELGADISQPAEMKGLFGESVTGSCALSLAVYWNHEEIVRLLLSHGATTSTADSNGRTPLHYVQSVGVLQQLLDAGADINVKDLEGNTPLHRACIRKPRSRYQHSYSDTPFSLLEIFLHNGADISATNNKGRTPLHVAMEDFNRSRLLPPAGGENGAISWAQAMLAHGADHSAKDHTGRTPLHIACNDNAVLGFFLDAGADINTRDMLGKTLLYRLVEKFGTQTLIWLLPEIPFHFDRGFKKEHLYEPCVSNPIGYNQSNWNLLELIINLAPSGHWKVVRSLLERASTNPSERRGS